MDQVEQFKKTLESIETLARAGKAKLDKGESAKTELHNIYQQSSDAWVQMDRAESQANRNTPTRPKQ